MSLYVCPLGFVILKTRFFVVSVCKVNNFKTFCQCFKYYPDTKQQQTREENTTSVVNISVELLKL